MQEPIDIVMPIEEGRCIPQVVLEGIVSQSVPFRLWVSTHFVEGHFADARNQVKQYGQSSFTLMLDNDIVLPDGALKRMIEFLRENDDFAAIGLCKRAHQGFLSDADFLNASHVDMSCVLFRCKMLHAVTFVDRRNAERLGVIERSGQCECSNCCDDLRRMGFRIGFLPFVVARHVHVEAFSSRPAERQEAF